MRTLLTRRPGPPTTKLRQLEVDLQFPRSGDVGTCSDLVGASILGCLSAQPEFSSFGGTGAGNLRRQSVRCLCFDRCRSKSFEMLNQIRVFASHVLAKNLKPTVRWVPSEFSKSDEPSRRCEPFPSVSRLLTHECDRVGESIHGCGAKKTQTWMHVMDEVLLVTTKPCVIRRSLMRSARE